MTNTPGDRLDRIETLLERFVEEGDKRINSNAKAIQSLTDEMQDLGRRHEQLIRRFDDFLQEMSQDRAEMIRERGASRERIRLLEDNQSRLIDLMRIINRKAEQRD